MTEEQIQYKLRYFRKVKALTTLIRAESYLREHLMLGHHLGMYTEGMITEEKATKELAEAQAYLNGDKDAEIRGWIEVEDKAVNPKSTAEYALATSGCKDHTSDCGSPNTCEAEGQGHGCACKCKKEIPSDQR